MHAKPKPLAGGVKYRILFISCKFTINEVSGNGFRKKFSVTGEAGFREKSPIFPELWLERFK